MVEEVKEDLAESAAKRERKLETSTTDLEPLRRY
jgi:hypothetical protein